MLTRILGAAFLVLASGSLARPADPERFESKDWKFSAQFPDKPKEVDQSAVGVKFKMFMTESKNGAAMIGVADVPIPANETADMIQARLDGARDGAIKNVGGQLLSSKAITLGKKKYPGREFSAKATKPVEGLLRARIYLVGTRLYQVVVMGTKEYATSKETDAFLDSFQVTE
jgi:hypothetical protein